MTLVNKIVQLEDGSLVRVVEEWLNCFDEVFYTLSCGRTIEAKGTKELQEHVTLTLQRGEAELVRDFLDDDETPETLNTYRAIARVVRKLNKELED